MKYQISQPPVFYTATESIFMQTEHCVATGLKCLTTTKPTQSHKSNGKRFLIGARLPSLRQLHLSMPPN